MRVLVVGHNRSATTWVGNVLGATAHSGFISEPDDSSWVPFAIRTLDGLGHYPVLGAADAGSRSMTRLWSAAFGAEPVRYVRGQNRVAKKLFNTAPHPDRLAMLGPDGHVTARLRLAGALAVPKHTPPSVENQVVKSVLSPFMLDWIRARWDPVVVVCFRHPLEVVASFIEVGLARGTAPEITGRMSFASRAVATDVYGVPEPAGDSVVAAVAWRVGLVMSVLDDARKQHPEFHVVEHATVCADPPRELHALADAVGLEWTDDTERFVVGTNQPGERYQISRVAREQKDLWRKRLSPDDVRAAADVLARFPIAARYDLGLTL